MLLKKKYRKLGGGTLTLADKKVIKPKEEFWAYPQEIPETFKKSLQVIDEQKPKQKQQTPEPPETPKEESGSVDINNDSTTVTNTEETKAPETEETKAPAEKAPAKETQPKRRVTKRNTGKK